MAVEGSTEIVNGGLPKAGSVTSARRLCGGTSAGGDSETTVPLPPGAGAKASVAVPPLVAAIARACASCASNIVAADRVSNPRLPELRNATAEIIARIAATSSTSISVVPRCASTPTVVPIGRCAANHKKLYARGMNKVVILIAAAGLLLGATDAQSARMHRFVSVAVAGAARGFVGYKPNTGAALSGDCGVRTVEGRKMLDCRFSVFEDPGRSQFISLFKAALPLSFKSSKCTFTGAYPHEDIMEETCFREPGGVEADVGTDDSGAAHLYFSAPAAVPPVAPSPSPADWRPAAMRKFFIWALDTAYKMSAPGAYAGPGNTPDDLRRLIGGCDPQARENPLRVDLLCGSAPDGVFANQAAFLAIANGRCRPAS